jgi:drug/metabolite transporter (DMT)-like permease
MTPVELVALRMTSAGVLFCVADWLMERIYIRSDSGPAHEQTGKRVRPLNWPLLLFAGFVGMYLLCGAEAWAISSMTATKATLIWALLPLITAAVARICGQQVSSSWRGTGGIVLGMAGILFLIRADQGTVWSISDLCSGNMFLSNMVLPDIVMLGAVIAAAFDYILTQRIMEEGHGILLSNGIMMLTGGILSTVTAYGIQGSTAFRQITFFPAIAYLAAIVILVNGIGLSLQSYLVLRHRVTLLALSSFLTPLLGVCMSLWWCEETWNNWYTGATLCICGGIYMFYRDEVQRTMGYDGA